MGAAFWTERWGLITFANENWSKIIVEDDEEEGQIAEFEFGELDFVVGASCRFAEASKDAL